LNTIIGSYVNLFVCLYKSGSLNLMVIEINSGTVTDWCGEKPCCSRTGIGFFLQLINEDGGRRRSEVVGAGGESGNRKMTNEIRRTRPDAVWKIDKSNRSGWGL
jgi:hypothetical protein